MLLDFREMSRIWTPNFGYETLVKYCVLELKRKWVVMGLKEAQQTNHGSGPRVGSNNPHCTNNKSIPNDLFIYL